MMNTWRNWGTDQRQHWRNLLFESESDQSDIVRTRPTAVGNGADPCRTGNGFRGASDKLRVVVADDERPARSFLASILRKFKDVEVVGEAVNGMEAVTLIESKRPDLALLDLQMPEVDGLRVVRLLKKIGCP
jgi:PleD family two-component response regulator